MAEFINMETFKKSAEERYCKPCKAEGKDHNGCWCRACWVDDMLDEVECFQPSDVAPVVHGRWIYDKKAQRPYCNVCKGYFYGATNSPMSYCPNCGAKMDGGAEDETD